MHSTPGVMNGITYVSGCDSKFRAVKIADGAEAYVVDAEAKLLWQYEHPQRKFPC